MLKNTPCLLSESPCCWEAAIARGHFDIGFADDITISIGLVARSLPVRSRFLTAPVTHTYTPPRHLRIKGGREGGGGNKQSYIGHTALLPNHVSPLQSRWTW